MVSGARVAMSSSRFDEGAEALKHGVVTRLAASGFGETEGGDEHLFERVAVEVFLRAGGMIKGKVGVK